MRLSYWLGPLLGFDLATPPEDLVAATRQAIAEATDFDERDANYNFQIGIREFDTAAHIELTVLNADCRTVEERLEYPIALTEINVILNVQNTGVGAVARTQVSSFAAERSPADTALSSAVTSPGPIIPILSLERSGGIWK